MRAARVFLRASVFKVRTCSVVQVRRVGAFLAIKQLPVLRKGRFVTGSSNKGKRKILPVQHCLLETRGRQIAIFDSS